MDQNMNAFVKGNARFTVIDEGAVRIEYSNSASFLDEPTLFAVRGNFSQGEGVFDGDTLTVKTERLTLTYVGNAPFSRDNLFVHIHTAGADTVWHYGDTLKNNLGGTLSTLDGVDGHRPLPDGIISRDGFYVLDDSNTPVLHDGWIQNRDKDHTVDIYFFAYGNDYKSALRSLRAAAGDFELPRRCVFGSWYSRWWRYTSKEFLDLADQYRDNDFPLDIMVMDMDWHYQDWGHGEGEPFARYGYGHCGENLGWTGYTWNRTAIPDPEGLICELAKRGIKVVLNDHPADGLRDHDEGYPEFIKELSLKNYKEEVPDVPERMSKRELENKDRDVVNFRFNAGSKVYMESFFRHALERIEKAGIEFWWLDWQQDYIYPAVNGIKNQKHLPWLNHLYYGHSRKGSKRGASFSRFGGIGDHKHPAFFSGDAVSGWDTLAFEVEMTATSANAGCFFWSHDIGGFMDPVPGGQAENYVRWVQFGAFSATLRLHMNGVEGFDRRPWTWGEPYCSAMREAFHLRSRFLPSIYSAAYKCFRDALPFIRPLYYEAPEREEAYGERTTYFLGEDIIVSPVCTPAGENGVAVSDLWLPDGDWVDYFTKKVYSDNRARVENDLFTFPLFVRANTPVVTRPYTSRMTSEPYGRLNIEIFSKGDGKGSTLLYEDDGESEGYKNGEYRTTDISFERENGKISVALKPAGCYEGAPERRAVFVTVYGVESYSSLLSDNEYTAEYSDDTLTVIFENTDANKPLCFTVI